MGLLRVIMLSLLLLACGETSSPGQQQARFRLDLESVLGGEAGPGYLRATEPRDFRFPEDHGLHPGFRNEWWYFTGNLATAEGRRFGYQLTFFSNDINGGQAEATGDSAWHSERLWMAHLALTDFEGEEHHAWERFSRENPGLAGARSAPFQVWLEDWRLTALDGEGPPWRLEAGTGSLHLDLRLVPRKAPVLQGEAGLSQKSPAPGNASYYYSLTRLATQGQLQWGGEDLAVSGLSWLDREWSTSALAEDQSGWDWFSLQLDDGRDLMYYQLRDQAGAAHPSSAGKLSDEDERTFALSPEQVRLQPLREWQSPSGRSYTVAWRLQLQDFDGDDWIVEAVMDGQWMDMTVEYWEGAVTVSRATNGELLGRGYLEMVREP